MTSEGKLRRLLTYIAAFGILAVLAWIVPEPAIKISLIVGGCVTVLAGCVHLVYLCGDRTTALLLMASGAFVGWLFCPTMESIRENQTWYDDFADNLLFTVVHVGIGVIVAGAMMYFGERLVK